MKPRFSIALFIVQYENSSQTKNAFSEKQKIRYNPYI